MALAPDHRKFRTQTVLAVVISVSFLILIWHRNYNLLGSFYDYSILTSAVGHLHAGLLSYRDFTTPLQSLTIWLCDAAELIFGQRYLALAYANLIAGLIAYCILLRMLKPALPFTLRIIVATAFTVSTFFQHGILWYNSVGMLLLAVICLQAVKLVHNPEICYPDVRKLCLLLFLSSINKLNFHALGMGLVFLAFASHCLLHKTKIKSVCLCGGSFLVAGIIVGPGFEILCNRTTLHDFIENIFRIPSGRSSDLLNFFNPLLYLGKVWDFYPDNFVSGVFLIGFLIYLGCLCVAIRPVSDSGDAAKPAAPFVKLCSLVALPVFFIASLLLTITNMETEVLPSFFLIIGLISVFVLLANHLSSSQRLVFQFALTVLAGFFLVAGSVSAFMHSRVRYWEPSWSDAMFKTVYIQRAKPAFKNPFPFFDAKTISPSLEPYFAGVHFTELAQKRLTRIASFMNRFSGGTNAPDIFWGPSLEILNRVYGEPRHARLPLWYHSDVTIREQDSPRIIWELDHAGYEWIVTVPLKNYFPPEIIDYIQKSYDCVEDDEIVVFHRKR